MGDWLKRYWPWLALAGLAAAGGVVFYKVRGLRLCNPGNIKAAPGITWQGQVGVDADGFVIFSSFYYGLRAMARILLNYQRRGLASVQQMIPTWSATDQAEYVANVAKALGVDPAAPLDLRANQPQLLAMMKAITTQENGFDPIPQATYETAILAAAA